MNTDKIEEILAREEIQVAPYLETDYSAYY